MESRARQRYEESREDAARFAETKPPSRPGTRYESRMPRLENIGEQLRSPRDVRKPSPDLPARTPSTQLALNFGFSPVVKSGAQVPPLSQSAHSSRLSGASLGRRSSSDVPILGVAPPRSERLLKLDAVCLVESLRHGKSSMLEELIELLGEEAAVKHVAAWDAAVRPTRSRSRRCPGKLNWSFRRYSAGAGLWRRSRGRAQSDTQAHSNLTVAGEGAERGCHRALAPMHATAGLSGPGGSTRSEARRLNFIESIRAPSCSSARAIFRRRRSRIQTPG